MGPRIGNQIKAGLKRALCFVRITDPHDGNISLTNLMLIATIIKVLTSKSGSYADLGLFLSAVGTYHAKKMLNQGAAMPTNPDPPSQTVSGGSVTPLRAL